jgi:hypothetical protein
LLVSAAYAGAYKEARAYATNKGSIVDVDPDVIAGLLMTNQKKQAIELLEELKAKNPDNASQIDGYIKQILAQPAAK